MKNYIFLDFDGVLFDTLKEAYIICRHSFCGTDYFCPVNEKEYKLFYKYKFLVYNSWQYYYLMKVLSSDTDEKHYIDTYKNCLENREYTKETDFDEKYYLARTQLMNEYHDFWDKLETPFPFAQFIKSGIENNNFNAIIVSKKNKNAIKYRLNQFCIDIAEADIYGKDELMSYETKAQFIHEYMNKNNIKKAYFIDDNSNNLKPCQTYKNILPLLAGWGNIAVGETGLSQEEVINILANN